MLFRSAFAEQIQPRLIAAGITREVAEATDGFTPEQIATQSTVSNYLKRIGLYGQ